MNKGKGFMTLILCGLLVLALTSSAGADTTPTMYAGPVTVTGYEYNDIFGYFASGPQTVSLNITPFDTTLGTLNSVTMYAEVNASGSLQAWYYGVSADLSYGLTNTLAVAEMGNTVASVSGLEPITGEPDFGAFYYFPVTANNYTITTLTSGFGRFLAGPDPFPVFLTLAGWASSSDPSMTDVYFNFDGNANLSYEYNYTPASAVPIPGAVWLLGSGLLGLVGLKRKFLG